MHEQIKITTKNTDLFFVAVWIDWQETERPLYYCSHPKNDDLGESDTEGCNLSSETVSQN